jgi:hypothetical protein
MATFYNAVIPSTKVAFKMIEWVAPKSVLIILRLSKSCITGFGLVVRKRWLVEEGCLTQPT